MCIIYTILDFANRNLELAANILLFGSALILLIDKAPVDFSSKQRKIRKAIELLREKKNICGPIPPGINVTPEGTVTVFKDESAFHYLLEFIFKNAPRADSWRNDKIVAIGHSVLSLPVGNNKLDAFFPLYFSIIPVAAKDTSLNLVPVGQLEDLDSWLTKCHIRSLNNTALYILVIGFFLQIIRSII